MATFYDAEGAKSPFLQVLINRENKKYGEIIKDALAILNAHPVGSEEYNKTARLALWAFSHLRTWGDARSDYTHHKDYTQPAWYAYGIAKGVEQSDPELHAKLIEDMWDSAGFGFQIHGIEFAWSIANREQMGSTLRKQALDYLWTKSDAQIGWYIERGYEDHHNRLIRTARDAADGLLKDGDDEEGKKAVEKMWSYVERDKPEEVCSFAVGLLHYRDGLGDHDAALRKIAIYRKRIKTPGKRQELTEWMRRALKPAQIKRVAQLAKPAAG